MNLLYNEKILDTNMGKGIEIIHMVRQETEKENIISSKHVA